MFKVTQNSCTYEFGARIYKRDENTWAVNAGYGYKHWTTKHREGWDSALRGQKYELHHQIMPKAGDVITHVKSGRTFVLGAPIHDFINHEYPLMENGKQVAIFIAEDYYKD